MIPRNFRTFNPWGHVSTADRMARLQIAKSLSDRANGKTWKIWQRPSGDDAAELKRTFTRYAPYQWKQCGSYAFENKKAALDFLRALVGSFGIEQVSENEYCKDAMRYIVEDEAAEQCVESDVCQCVPPPEYYTINEETGAIKCAKCGKRRSH